MRLVCAVLLSLLAGEAGAASHTVTIEGMKFVPERLEIKAGDKVIWVNKDFVPHTVTATKSGVESGDLAQGKRWTFTAKRRGEMDYICRLHPGMHGTLIIK